VHIRNGRSLLDVVGYMSAVAAGFAALAHNVDVVVIRIRELVRDVKQPPSQDGSSPPD
jgi:hypothetical protein